MSGGSVTIAELDLADWRRRVAELYAAVRADDDPQRAHARWRAVRDELIGKHPQSPALPGDPVRSSGVPYWPYDPALRFELPLVPAAPASLTMATDGGTVTALRLIGRVEVPGPVDASLDVWALRQYAGGLFVPVRDGRRVIPATAGAGTCWTRPRARTWAAGRPRWSST